MNLNQVTVPSLDIQVSIDFYCKLGLELIVKALPHYARFTCPESEATFSAHLVDSVPSESSILVYFECEELDAQVAQLVKSGIKFDSLPQDKPWLWREARLRDPFNNLLVLYRAGENRLNPPWRIN